MAPGHQQRFGGSRRIDLNASEPVRWHKVDLVEPETPCSPQLHDRGVTVPVSLLDFPPDRPRPAGRQVSAAAARQARTGHATRLGDALGPRRARDLRVRRRGPTGRTARDLAPRRHPRHFRRPVSHGHGAAANRCLVIGEQLLDLIGLFTGAGKTVRTGQGPDKRSTTRELLRIGSEGGHDQADTDCPDAVRTGPCRSPVPRSCRRRPAAPRRRGRPGGALR